jgi:hypothetical protein
MVKRVGLLFNRPPGEPGCLSISLPKSLYLLYLHGPRTHAQNQSLESRPQKAMVPSPTSLEHLAESHRADPKQYAQNGVNQTGCGWPLGFRNF